MNKISGVIESFSDYTLLFEGDLNCNVHDNNIFANLIKDFMQTHDLVFCDQKIHHNDRITCQHASLAHSSYIDFLFISKPFFKNLVDYKILDLALNHSDHFPLLLSIHSALDDIRNAGSNNNIDPPIPSDKSSLEHLRWDQANLANYCDETFRSLDPLRLKMQTFIRLLGLNADTLHSVPAWPA